jgi:Arabinose efflux permease
MKSNVSLTLVLALCTMLGALGIDTYLPSFHAIAQEFGVGPAAVQQTLSVYVLAMAITMLFYGTLSDTFGRRRVLMVASMGYALTPLPPLWSPALRPWWPCALPRVPWPVPAW